MKRKRISKAKEASPSGAKTIDLHQLIEDRKQEKRKALNEESHKKLRAIQDRRTSGERNEPFPNDAFERFKRNDVWGNVLDYLTNPTDVADSYFTCRTFSEILNKRRMLMALPKMLNVFKRKVDEAFELENEEIGATYYEQWNIICLNARRVCKAWKKTVDSHTDNASEDWLITTDWTDEDDHDPRTNVFIFNDEESVDEVTSALIIKGLSLSPVRDVFLKVNDHISVPFYRKLMEYIKTHGSSLRYVSIEYGRPGNIAPSVRERFICDMVKYMVNMKRLYITFHDDDDDDDDDEMSEVEETFQNMQRGLNEYEVSSLESLEHFSCCDWETESFVSQFLRKCVNVKSVDLAWTEPAEMDTTEALMQLPLHRFGGMYTVITSNQATWPLTHLKISRTEMDVNASILFPAINRFQETLQHLHLWAVVKMDGNVSLELPHLKSIFILLVRRGNLGFDDLLPLKSLEEIMVEKRKSVKYENENALVKVKRYFDRGEMHMSNIWHCFTNLKLFQVQLGRTYSRPTTHA